MIRPRRSTSSVILPRADVLPPRGRASSGYLACPLWRCTDARTGVASGPLQAASLAHRMQWWSLPHSRPGSILEERGARVEHRYPMNATEPESATPRSPTSIHASASLEQQLIGGVEADQPAARVLEVHGDVHGEREHDREATNVKHARLFGGCHAEAANTRRSKPVGSRARR